MEVYVTSRGGQAEIKVRKSQILALISLSQIRKFLRYASPQIANPQIAQKSRLFTRSQIAKMIGSANCKNDWFRKLQIPKGHICGKSANQTSYLSLQIFGFEICGTYLQIAQLW
jgi:hypothetical protein